MPATTRLHETARTPNCYSKMSDVVQHIGELYPSSSSGIHQLPVELLSEIFAEYAHAFPFDMWDASDGPRLLETVCSSWRAVVIASPRVWSSFVVVSRPEMHSAIQLQILRTHLSRSAATPLTFSFYTGFTTSDQNPLLDLLLNESHRWLDVILELPLALYPSMNRIAGRVPLLHILSLRAKSGSSAHVGDVVAFYTAPRLQKLSLWGNWTALHNLEFPWHQLVAYADEDGSGTEPKDLLSMTSLVNLTYRPRRVDPLQFIGVDGPHRLETLTTLRILSAQHLGVFLDNAVMPSLREVTMDDMCLRYEVKSISAPLESLLLRSQCSIHALTIDNLAFGDTPHLLRLFKSMPDLASLSIRHWATKELSKLSRALHGRNGSRSILPKLTSISLQSDLTTAVVDVVDMVESRWEMKRLEFPTYPVYDHFSLSRLRGLAQKGLKVCFNGRINYAGTWY